ncbi:MAG: nucleotidyl transferase AbiEii/AbiGii toxin family protein [Anaerovoracaceae bacterium]
MVVVADTAASVLAKLRNKAKASGISYQQCLQLFVQEEFLRKLSKSGCEDNLILKGGLFIYTLTNFESRATIDVDFLLRKVSNSIEDVKSLICKIIDTPTGNDYISMTAKGFEEISPQRRYHGISAQIIAQIKNVRIPFNVDIGVGDVIVPCAEEREINTQLSGFEVPVIKTYSIESTIAEKLDAILQRFELTGRMKDFYDIYYLARTFDFDGTKLQKAIFETLQQRGTPYNNVSFKRIVSLAENEDIQKRWRYFLKSIEDDTLEFNVVIDEIREFLEPVFDAIINEKEWRKVWKTAVTQWK